MRIEDFGFTPTVGEEYVVTFSNEGNLLSNVTYDGSPLPAVNFPENSKITFTVTDKVTGKVLMNSDFIHYNGKLYKTNFQLPLKDANTNKNANIYINELHYDLTTGSVLVQVQGFAGEQYKLSVADKELSSQAMTMDITLEDNMHYSIPTTLVQGATFEVHLLDSHGKSVDVQEFTAPISTDWRHTDTTSDEVTLDNPDDFLTDPEQETEVPIEDDGSGLPIDQNGTNPNEQFTEQHASMNQESGNFIEGKEPFIYGAAALMVVLILILIVRMMKRKKAAKAFENNDKYVDEENELNRDDDEFDEYNPEDEDEFREADAGKQDEDDEFVEASPFDTQTPEPNKDK